MMEPNEIYENLDCDACPRCESSEVFQLTDVEACMAGNSQGFTCKSCGFDFTVDYTAHLLTDMDTKQEYEVRRVQSASGDFFDYVWCYPCDSFTLHEDVSCKVCGKDDGVFALCDFIEDREATLDHGDELIDKMTESQKSMVIREFIKHLHKPGNGPDKPGPGSEVPDFQPEEGSE